MMKWRWRWRCSGTWPLDGGGGGGGGGGIKGIIITIINSSINGGMESQFVRFTDGW
jgi:hypothetical protein